MQRKLISLLLAVVMVFSLGTTAFAGTGDPESVLYDANADGEGLASGATKFSTTSDNKTTIDEYYSLTKEEGLDNGELDYYVKLEWTKTTGGASIEGDTYRWDANKQAYEKVATGTALHNNTPATLAATITNYSNAEVKYEITYATADGFDTTEAATSGDKTGTIDSYTKDVASITNSGDDTYKPTGITAPTATYAGEVTLIGNNNTAKAMTSTIVGTYTVNITAGPAVKQTVTATIDASANTKLTSDVTPAAETGKKTTVEFQKTTTALTNGSKAQLTVDVEASLVAAADNTFVLSTNSNTAVGALDLTLKVDGVAVSSFTDVNNQPVAAKVTTYVAKGIEGIKLSYNGVAFKQVDSETAVDTANDFWYDSETGKLVFMTTHFSTFVVEGSNEAYIENSNTAYATLAAAIEAAAANDTITVLKDCETGSSYTMKSPLTLAAANVTLDLNEKTITTTNNFTFVIAGDNDIVKNGTIQSKERSDSGVAPWSTDGTGTYYRGYPLVVAKITTGGTVTGVQVNNVEIHGGISAGGSKENNETTILGGAEVTLVDCTISGGASQTLYAQLGSTLTVVSGTYSKPKGALANAETANYQHLGEAASTIIIKGGTFNNEDPSAYVASGYVASKSDTTYTVSAVQ